MASLLIYKQVKGRLTRVGKVDGDLPKAGSEFVFEGETYLVSSVDMDVRRGRPPTIKVFLHEAIGH